MKKSELEAKVRELTAQLAAADSKLVTAEFMVQRYRNDKRNAAILAHDVLVCFAYNRPALFYSDTELWKSVRAAVASHNPAGIADIIVRSPEFIEWFVSSIAKEVTK